MDRVDALEELTEIVQREVADYNNGSGWKMAGYYLKDVEKHVYTIILVPDYDHPDGPKPVIMMMARIVGDKVVIDEDITDRPLYEELMRCGIAREQIVLVYAGEQLDTTESNP